MSGSCIRCRSYAINPGLHGRDDTDLDLCDVCYWRARAESNDTLRAQLEAAERLVAAVEVQAEENFQKYVDANEARIDAEARAEAAEADAARYQLLKVWGRQMSIEGTGECNFGITTPTWRGPWIDLDAAIDAAMARTKEQQA